MVDHVRSKFVITTTDVLTILIGVWPQIGTRGFIEESLGLIQFGQGDKPVSKARLRCRYCGEVVEKQVRPPVPEFGGAVAYN